MLQIVGTMVDKNSYNPRYHGTDGVAEKTAITDTCVCVCEIPPVGKSRVLGSTGQLQPTTQVTLWRALGFQREKHLEPEKCLEIG